MLRVAVIEKKAGYFTKKISGPMRVAYELCKSWDKTKEVEVIALSSNVISLLQSRFKTPLPFIRRALLTARANSSHFDILNLHGVSKDGVEIAKVCKRRRIPLVYTAHGAAYKEKEMGYPYSNMFIQQEKLLVSFADKIVAVSEMIKRLIIDKYKIPDEKIDVIYNGVDPNLGQKKYKSVDIRKKYGIPHDRKILLNVGGTRKVKDIPFLIKALEMVKRDDWHLVLVGDKGEDHEHIMHECRSKLGDRYTFTGVIGENELLSFYHQALLFVASSKYEGFMLSPLEALCCGTDIVIRATMPGAQRYFCNKKALVKTNIFASPQELAAIIVRYLDGNQKIDNYDKEQIIKFHSWENRAKEYLRIFEHLTCKC
ncbi:MAG: glycosyltransferase family 4 protein [Candidatus Jordarchaeaceae archaeon]